MPNVALKRIDWPGEASVWEVKIKWEQDVTVTRFGRSVAYALRKLADAVNELEQPEVIEEMRRNLKSEQEGEGKDGTAE